MGKKNTPKNSDLPFQLRTLLNSTTGMLEIAAATEDRIEQANYYQIALAAAKQASDLLNEFLEPRTDKPKEALEASKPTQKPKQSPKLNILLAEDNVINQRIVCKLLERRGHTVTIAGNGRIAVDSAAQENFDLILMDIKMPVMDGLDAASFIRANENNSGKRHVPIVALTAVGEAELQSLSEVMDDVIQKPFDTSRFMRTVESITASRT